MKAFVLRFAILASIVIQQHAHAAPRPPLPPLPELVRASYTERFDASYTSDSVAAEIQVAGLGRLVESWSGYALERRGPVIPFVIDGVKNGTTNLFPNGAVRLWIKPDWSSATTGAGQGPGHKATLLELSVVSKNQAVPVWSLQASADGSLLYLSGTGQKESGLLLKTEIAWQAGQWHQVILNYTEQSTSLVLDGVMVAEGPGVVVVPAPVAALTVGSSLLGTESTEGELEEVYCFMRPLTMAFHYEALKDAAAKGAITTEELAYRAELSAKWKAAKAQKVLEEAESGGGGAMMLRLSGPSVDCVTNGPVYLTNVVCNFTTNDGWTVYFDIMGGTNEVDYDIFSTPDLTGGDITNSVWTWLETGRVCETHYFTNQATNQTFYILTIPGADRDGDGLYDGWEWKHFGTLAQTAEGDFDGNGISNGEAYTNSVDPNEIQFALDFGTRFVNADNATGNIFVSQGVPEQMAVLINSTNFTAAIWQPYQSNITASLGRTDGEYSVWVGLRGHSWLSGQTWRGVTITRDTVPPELFITQPSSNLMVQPVLQLLGHANEPLLTVHYDLTNAAGLQTNLPGYVTQQHLDTNTLRYTTNWWQCYDVALETNENSLVLRVVDRAGNETSTNVDYTLDYSGDTNAPIIALTWPEENALVAGSSFALRGELDDATASVKVELGANSYSGTVERDGQFEVPALPLIAATNTLTVIATDVAGNSRTNTRVVRQSSETLTINPVDASQLTGPTVNLSGTVGVSEQNVWVNNLPAEVEGNTWNITVPTPTDNVANFNVQTGPTLESPTALQSLSTETPPHIEPVGYTEEIYVGQTGDCGSGWFTLTESRRDWTPEEGPFENLGLPAWQNLIFYSGQSDVHPFPNDCAATYIQTYKLILKSHTKVELRVGGVKEFERMRLVRMTVAAAAYTNELTIGIAPGDIPIPVSSLRLYGQTPTATATNAYVGELFVAFPAGSTNEATFEVAGTNAYSFAVQAEVVKATLLADGNRDGAIGVQAEEAISSSNPFRFWINDDKDDGDTGGDDIPGQADIPSQDRHVPVGADYHTAVGGDNNGIGVVDGTRDLIDFFPVYLDITNLLALLPPNATNQYKLKQQNDAVNVVFTTLTRDQALDFQTDAATAQNIVARYTRKVTSTGLVLPTEFLTGIANGTNGVILVEGRAATTNPLKVVVEKQGVPVVELVLPLRIGGVELMFRHLNLNYASSGGNNEVPTRATAPNEPPTNGKNFAFMHGYNVNQEQARGWGAEIFKRMWWAGSKARFFAVSWHGYETQIMEPFSISYNLQTNIVHAFETAPVLANFINNLSGETVIAGHSLGNMLASAAVTRFGGMPAKYFMIDGAVAMEAFDPDLAKPDDMVNANWDNYHFGGTNDFLFASEWHKLFPSNDARSQLTWRGIFTNWGNTVVYNYYSSGEEIMRNIPAVNGNNFGPLDAARYPWGCQEKLKGRMVGEFLGSTIAGWAYNMDDYGSWNDPGGWEGMPPANAAALNPSTLVTQPFFEKTPADLFSTNMTTAQSFAQQHYYDLLSRAFPARTYGVGANPIGGDVFEQSIDLQLLQKPLPTGWTTSRDDTFWKHSDCQDMAYLFTHQFFEMMVNIGELK